MQAVAQNTTTDRDFQTSIVVTVEAVAIIVLIGVSVLLRLVSLGSVPITTMEVPQALSAWRSVSANAPGTMIVADSPILFWIQRISFGLLGNSEAAARVGTALAGVVLSLLPLLFRDLLGRARAYLFAVLLTLSPVLLVASRFSSGVVWAMVFAGIALWALWRYWNDDINQAAWGTVVTVTFGAMLLLSEPGGPVLGIILLGAAAAALLASVLIEPDDREIPWNDYVVMILGRFRGWPWGYGLLFAALTVVAISTAFLLNPGGLGSVSALLDGFFSGFSDAGEGAPAFFPLLVSGFYEPWLWVFAFLSVAVLYRRSQLNFVELFLIVWVLMGLLASLAYSGAGAAHGLWMIVPLAGLSSFIFADALVDRMRPGLLFDESGDGEDNIYSARWGKWLLGILMLTLLLIAALQLQVVSRFFLAVPDGSLSEYLNRLRVPLPKPSPAMGLLWLFISLMFIVAGGFVGSSIWGNAITWQAGVLGAAAFAMISSVAIGWNVAVANANDPVELWHSSPPSRDVTLLRETLLELSFRETQGEPLVPMAVLAEDDGVVAWQVRDFPNARFVETLADALAEEIVLMPAPDPAASAESNSATLPELDASYVGQKFILSYTWSADTMRGLDFVPWWVVRDTRVNPVSDEAMVLWIRQDIYDSEPYSLDQPGSR